MLVISREVGQSISIELSSDEWIVTVLKFRGESVAVDVREAKSGRGGRSQVLVRGESIRVAEGIVVTLVDVRGERAFVGVEAPDTSSVHRLEVLQAIRRERGNGGSEGTAGAPVPGPSSPRPPALRVRREEPRSTDEGGK